MITQEPLVLSVLQQFPWIKVNFLYVGTGWWGWAFTVVPSKGALAEPV